MCGIVGVHYFNRERRVSAEHLRAMNDQIVHRGPDDEGVALFGHSGFGMRRLSIIDLGGSHQPIFSPSRRHAIVFNGEAFNFLERRAELASANSLSTQGDTEVVLHLYLEHGDRFVHKINGMFGLAIWDEDKQRLLLARDRLGIKPLYYYLDNDRLVYGSEIKSLLAHPEVKAELDTTKLALFFEHGYTPAPHTLFRGIHKLPPGHLLLTTDRGVDIVKYWDVSYEDKLTGSDDDIAAGLYDLLKSSVRYRLIADVPLGAFLSGGVDSSSIVHMMRDLEAERVETYNIGYGGAYAAHDESADAREIAQHYGTHHHEILATPDVKDLFPRLVRHLDEPLADSSFIVTYLVSELAAQSVKVILSGVGGDEIFGGYRRYLNVKLNRLWQRVPQAVRRGVLLPLLNALPEDRNSVVLNYFRLAKGFARSAELPPLEQYRDITRVLGPEVLAQHHEGPPDPFVAALAGSDARDPVDRILYADLKTSLPEQLLLLTDKMSMACSIEVRVPYLDYRVVEYAARIPVGLKIRGNELRHIQKRAFAGRLPKAVLKRKKRGFGAPTGAWLRGELRPLCDELLGERRLREQGLFDTGFVRGLLDGHMKKRLDGSDGLVALLTFQLWHDAFFGAGRSGR